MKDEFKMLDQNNWPEISGKFSVTEGGVPRYCSTHVNKFKICPKKDGQHIPQFYVGGEKINHNCFELKDGDIIEYDPSSYEIEDSLVTFTLTEVD